MDMAVTLVFFWALSIATAIVLSVMRDKTKEEVHVRFTKQLILCITASVIWLWMVR